MAVPPKIEPGDLMEEELLDIVERIRDAVWPRGIEGRESDVKIAKEVIAALKDYHLEP